MLRRAVLKQNGEMDQLLTGVVFAAHAEVVAKRDLKGERVVTTGRPPWLLKRKLKSSEQKDELARVLLLLARGHHAKRERTVPRVRL